MKIWMAEKQDDTHGRMLVWDSSEIKVRKRAMNEWSAKPDRVGQIEIGTGQAGFIEWLNQRFTRNNG